MTRALEAAPEQVLAVARVLLVLAGAALAAAAVRPDRRSTRRVRPPTTPTARSHPGTGAAATRSHPGTGPATVRSHPGTGAAATRSHPGTGAATVRSHPGAIPPIARPSARAARPAHGAAGPPTAGSYAGAAPARGDRRSRRHRADAGGPGRRQPWLLEWRAARRRRDLEAAVPEVLDLLRATVGAGLAPRRALEAATEAAPPPLAALLAEALRAAQLGSGSGQALAAVGRRERLTELSLAGEALDLAEATGAPPGPVLGAVATAAADRVRGRQALLAATAEARLSARVVAGMAPAFLLVLAVTAPSDAAFLIRERLGWATLAAAAVFEALGVWWAARIVGAAP